MVVPRLALVLLFPAGFALGVSMRPAPHAATIDDAPAAATAPDSHRAQIVRVIDGDTVEARIAIWIGQEIVTKIRLRGIDAPELAGACAQERERAEAARERLRGLVQGQPVIVSAVGPDRYFGRVVARIASPSGQDLGQQLLGEGLARPYRGGRRESWC